MDIAVRILLAVVFYGLMSFFYFYSKGRFNVKENKRERYLQWVEKNGEKSSKAIEVLTIIFSLLFVLNIFI